MTVFTGNGLKDPDTAIHEVHADIHKMADVEEMRLHMRAGVEKL